MSLTGRSASSSLWNVKAMTFFRSAVIFTVLHLLHCGGDTKDSGGTPANVSGAPSSFASVDQIFGGPTAKVSALGDCDKYRVQIGPHDRRLTNALGIPQEPSSSSVEVIMDNTTGIMINYIDNDILVAQAGDIGLNLKPGPFMFFATKRKERLTIQMYLQETPAGEFGHPQVVYFEGTVAGQPLKWPEDLPLAACAPLCRTGSLFDQSTLVL